MLCCWCLCHHDAWLCSSAGLTCYHFTGVAGSSNSEVADQLADTVRDAIRVRRLLSENTQEVTSLMRALNGEYVMPQAGGDLLRDGPGVLPTGRNIHALDPYRMPSAAAAARGAAAGQAILDSHQAVNDGALPETVAVNLWGLDSIKTRGDNVGLVLWLVGARPVREGTGRIARFELIPLEELGRPRIDVLCNMSGIFRSDTLLHILIWLVGYCTCSHATTPPFRVAATSCCQFPFC